MTDMIAPPQRDQSLGDEGTVETGQRRHVGNGAERHMMQHSEQIRLGPLDGPESSLAQLAVDGDQRDEHEANGGEMTEAGEIVRTVRIHQRLYIRQLVAALMMVDHHDRHPETPSLS